MEISKKQFIIITIIVCIVTVCVVTIIVSKNKGKANKIIEENIDTQEIPDETPQLQFEKNTNKDKNNNDNNDDDEENIEEDIKDNTNNNLTEEEITTTKYGTQITDLIEEVENSDIFGEMIKPTEDEIDDYFKLDVELLDEYVIMVSKNKFKSEMYMIIKPIDSNEEKVRDDIKKFLINYENSWINMDYKQYDLVSNRKAIKRNGYLIYVISSNNDEFMDIARKYL